MNKFLIAVICLVMTLTAQASDSMSNTSSEMSKPILAETPTIRLYAGQAQMLKTGRIKRVAVGNGKLVAVTQLPDALLLIGSGIGATNLLVWDSKGGIHPYNVIVSASDATQAARDLSLSLSSIPGLAIKSSDGHVVLSGDVTAADAQKIGKATSKMVVQLSFCKSSA